jgi:hypothetical protein
MSSPLTPPPRARRGTPTDDLGRDPGPATSGGATFARGSGAPADPGVVEPDAFDDLGTDEPARARAERGGKHRTAAVRRPERRFRQTIVKFDLWSVTKMALCFYSSAMAVFVVALIALWVVADSAGVIKSVEKFVGDLFSSKNFTFLSGQVLRGAVLVCVVLVALLTVITIVGASFYNIFAELFGGVEVVIREEEHPVRG